MEFLETFQPSADRKVAQWDVESFKFEIPRGFAVGVTVNLLRRL
jgi:hypothetical protein